MKQTEDFRQEINVLASVLESLSEADFEQVTLFKGWTINDVIGHLYMFDVAALKSLESDTAFDQFFAPIAALMGEGKTLLETQYPWLDGLKGRALYEAWRKNANTVADSFSTTDPKKRLKWAGPDMSALSSVTARQMETWAHGQEIFDVLGKERQEGDRIRNIAHLGVNTFGWAFINRKLPVPNPAPYVRLVGPSGAVWEWNEPQADNAVSGQAVEFASVVTQVRGFQDTSLVATGPTASRWMEIAQCFAGPAETPPSKGQRRIKSNVSANNIAISQSRVS
ncbi:MAG: TIGR03084 family metal-binding protein [Rhodobacterales bacterium]